MILKTKHKKISADLHTPVSLYLKLRDKYSQPLLLESSDYHSRNNSSSIICLAPLSTFSVSKKIISIRTETELKQCKVITGDEILVQFQKFRNSFITDKLNFSFPYSGFFGFTSYNAAKYFEPSAFGNCREASGFPDMHYSFYSLEIVINHFNDELHVFSHSVSNEEAERNLNKLISEMESFSPPEFSFCVSGNERSDCSESDFLELAARGINHCKRGDIFQVVLSRRFQQRFSGDEFEVYRALRNVNPSPYLYYFDFADFKIFGSSPEAQLVIKQGKAEIHPIAGTVRRTGDDEKDLMLAEDLKQNKKENAEHIMLVDLARNDLGRHCKNVCVEKLREVQFYSHVIHLVSKVCGDINDNSDVFQLMLDSFPAGTLSGAPKVRAMQIIGESEKTERGFYGGAVGFIGCDGSLNHAIVIRSFLSEQNNLFYRAGAGIVEASDPHLELNEIENKVDGLRKAIGSAAAVHSLSAKTASENISLLQN